MDKPLNFYELENLKAAKQKEIEIIMQTIAKMGDEALEKFEGYMGRIDKIMEKDAVLGMFAVKASGAMCDLAVYAMQCEDQEPSILADTRIIQ